MAQYNIEDYETVQSRLPKFFKNYTEGRVITHLMSDVNQLETVVFKAELYDGETLLSTGWAFEKEGKGYVNKISHLENCETSAIGRALANITIHGDKRPSREEMEKVQRTTQQNEAREEDLLSLDQVTVIQDETNSRQGFDELEKMFEWITKNWKYPVPVKEIADIRASDYDKILRMIRKKPLKDEM